MTMEHPTDWSSSPGPVPVNKQRNTWSNTDYGKRVGWHYGTGSHDGPAGALTTMFLCDHGARVIRVVDSSDTMPRRAVIWFGTGARSASGWTCRGSYHQHSVTIRCYQCPTASDDLTTAYEQLLRVADDS